MLNKHASSYVKSNGLEKEASTAAFAHIGAMFLPQLLKWTRKVRVPLTRAIKGTEWGGKAVRKIRPWYHTTNVAGKERLMKVPSQLGAWFDNSALGKSKFFQGVKQGLAASNKEYYRDALQSAKLQFGRLNAAELDDLITKRVSRALKAEGITDPSNPRYKEIVDKITKRTLSRYNSARYNPVKTSFGDSGTNPVFAPRLSATGIGQRLGYIAKPWQWKPVNKGMEAVGTIAALPLLTGGAEEDDYNYDEDQALLDYYRKTYGVDPNQVYY